MKDQPEVQDFLKRDINVLSNPDLGSKNFNQIKPQFEELRDMLLEVIEVSSTQNKIPGGLQNQAYGFVRHWNALHKQIQGYNLDGDAKSEFRTRQNIINEIAQWYEGCFSGYDQRQQKPNNFLGIYNAIKNFNLNGVDQERKKLNDLVTDFERQKLSVDTITEELRKKSAEQTVSDYSLIFKQESEKHSCIRLGLSIKKIRLGSAEVWLIVGIVLVALFGYALLNKNIGNLFGWQLDSDATPHVLIHLLTRLLIISLWVYLISFCFKQYSVSKHLATLNRHRSNTLNSFKLFIESIDPSDNVTKNALMLEVAKAIYEHGNTGHLSFKTSDTNPSIIELTRFVNQSAKS